MMITLFRDVVERMHINAVVSSVKGHYNTSVEVYCHPTNQYAAILTAYAAVGAASRISAYTTTVDNAWRNALRVVLGLEEFV